MVNDMEVRLWDPDRRSMSPVMTIAKLVDDYVRLSRSMEVAEEDMVGALQKCTLRRSTGQKDMDGQLIFEGDIVEDNHRRIKLVEWVERPNRIGFNIGTNMETVRKILGNIYENPELQP